MNYLNLYHTIINRRKATPCRDQYTEKHHIIPRSLGGSDDADNLVNLTAREHFICHYLLVKIYSEGPKHFKMLRAFLMMLVCSDNQARYVPSRKYQILKEKHSVHLSETYSGSGNPHFGKMWIHNTETRENTRINKNEPVPEGWKKGRIVKWDSEQPMKQCRTCSTAYPMQKKNYCSKDCIQKKKVSLSSRALQGKRCSVKGIEYAAVSIAADALGIGHETMRMRIKSPNFSDYYYIE